MPVLKSLSFTAIPKTGNDPVQARRAKFVTKLEEQKLLLKDPNHVGQSSDGRRSTGSDRPPPSGRLSVPGRRRTQPARSLCPSSLGVRPIEFEKGHARRPVQGQAAGGDRYPDLGRPSRGAERAVQPGRRDRIYWEGAESCLIIGRAGNRSSLGSTIQLMAGDGLFLDRKASRHAMRTPRRFRRKGARIRSGSEAAGYTRTRHDHIGQFC
jgi:hypothetical protein